MNGTTTVFGAVSTYVSFGANLLFILVAGGGGIIFIITLYKGGSRFWQIGKRIGKFIDRVDMIIDDFFPDILQNMERMNLITQGALARWTSAQAKTLKSDSPITITDQGNHIIDLLPNKNNGLPISTKMA